MRILSLKEALLMLVVNAGYPFGFVRKHCVNWASSWTPKGYSTAPDFLVSDVKLCVDWLEQFCIRHGLLALCLKSCGTTVRGRNARDMSLLAIILCLCLSFAVP